MSSHCLLISIRFWEVNCFCYRSSRVQVEMFFHFLFSRFTFIFEHFYYNVFHNGSLFICPVWSFSTSWMCRLVLFFISAKFPDIIYLIHLLPFPLFLFPLVYPSHNLVCLIVSQIFLRFYSLFFNCFFLFSSDCLISTHLSSVCWFFLLTDKVYYWAPLLNFCLGYLTLHLQIFLFFFFLVLSSPYFYSWGIIIISAIF